MVINKSIIRKLEEMNVSYEQLIFALELFCTNNKERYVEYIRNIQDNSITGLLTKAIIDKEDIDWIIASSRGLPRYFDNVNRNDFTHDFFIALDNIMERMSEIRNEIQNSIGLYLR